VLAGDHLVGQTLPTGVGITKPLWRTSLHTAVQLFPAAALALYFSAAACFAMT
jgi:hypothetical protein